MAERMEIHQNFHWQGNKMICEVIGRICSDMEKEVDEQILRHFETDFTELREYLEAKRNGMELTPVVHGRWTSTDIISKKAGYGVRYFNHAECKVNPCRLFECENDYCPCCGAKMDGERKEYG